MGKLLVLPRSTDEPRKIRQMYAQIRDEKHRRRVARVIKDLLAIEAERRRRESGAASPGPQRSPGGA